jgi:hypothetical protein
VNKKVVHRFPISLAQATSVHNDEMPLLEMSTVRILPRTADHAKKSRPRRSLSPTHTLPRKASTFRASQEVEEGLDLEKLSISI